MYPVKIITENNNLKKILVLLQIQSYSHIFLTFSLQGRILEDNHIHFAVSFLIPRPVSRRGCWGVTQTYNCALPLLAFVYDGVLESLPGPVHTGHITHHACLLRLKATSKTRIVQERYTGKPYVLVTILKRIIFFFKRYKVNKQRVLRIILINMYM